jgi:hypothetical protein
MLKLLPLCCLVLLLSSGCLFSRRSANKDKPLTAEVQETFHKRWVDKRTAELTASGVAAEAARAQAETEFRAQYDFKPPGSK